jgi:predicted DNA-binding transcriptional regulator AlpA
VTGPNRLPSADEIAAMTPEEAEEALVAATSVLPLLVAKAREPRSAEGPEWITVDEAARTSGMSRFFFYDHWKELSFCRKIGRSVKLNRMGLKQWLETKKAA